MRLVDALAATGKPLVIVLMNGNAIALQGAAQQASARFSKPGIRARPGGTAIADTLFGANNPSGRLPVTFYASDESTPSVRGTTHMKRPHLPLLHWPASLFLRVRS